MSDIRTRKDRLLNDTTQDSVTDVFREDAMDSPRDADCSIDAHVGSRVRLRRNLLGMSQTELGKELGITFQQIQKYERGMNRIGAGRLLGLSRVLDVPISFFYDDLSDSVEHSVPGTAWSQHGLGDTLARRETADLVRAYYNIEDADLRRKLLDVVRSCSLATASQAKITPTTEAVMA